MAQKELGMKKLSIVLVGFVAGTLILLGANALSVASETVVSKTSARVTSSTADQHLAYRTYHRPYCYKVKRCVRTNRYGYCKRWKWIRVCPGWRS